MYPSGWPSFLWIPLLNALLSLAGLAIAALLHRPSTLGQHLALWTLGLHAGLFITLWFCRDAPLAYFLVFHLLLLADWLLPAGWFFLRQRQQGNLMVWGAVTLIGCWLLELFFTDTLHDFPVLSACVFMAAALGLCINYLVKLARRPAVLQFGRHPGFWIAIGLLPYSSVSLLVYLSYGWLGLERAIHQPGPLALLQSLTLLWQSAAFIIAFTWYRRKSISGRS